MIQLLDGPIVRDEAVALACELEARGHALSVKDDRLVVTDGSTLTAADRAAIQAERLHLMAICAYVQEGHEPK